MKEPAKDPKSTPAEDPRQKRLRQSLQQARNGRKLTQGELAQQLGWDQTAVSRFEKGNRDLTVIEFLDVCRILRKDPVKLLLRIRRAAGASAKETPPNPDVGQGGV